MVEVQGRGEVKAKEWAKEFTRLAEELLQWARDFGRVIGVSDDHSSQAFDAFVTVIREGILPTCWQFKKAIYEELAEELASLNKMAENPEKLVAAMTTPSASVRCQYTLWTPLTMLSRTRCVGR